MTYYFADCHTYEQAKEQLQRITTMLRITGAEPLEVANRQFLSRCSEFWQDNKVKQQNSNTMTLKLFQDEPTKQEDKKQAKFDRHIIADLVARINRKDKTALVEYTLNGKNKLVTLNKQP